MCSYIKTDKGTINVSDTVLAKIVSDTVMSSYGIVGLTHRNAANGLNAILHKDKMFKGVIIEKSDLGLIINLDVILKYGVKIPTLIENLTETIKYRTETITGLRVDAINIYVQGLRI